MARLTRAVHLWLGLEMLLYKNMTNKQKVGILMLIYST
jgi:hypothetical protein